MHVTLHASDKGRPLYESLGFEPTNEMRLKLGTFVAPRVPAACPMGVPANRDERARCPPDSLQDARRYTMLNFPYAGRLCRAG